MKIIIAGAGAVGSHLATLLSREQHDITLIDDSAERLAELANNLDILTLCASPRSISTLKEAGCAKAHLFIAVMPDEAHNMTACMVAARLGAKRTVARVDNEEYTHDDYRDFLQSLGVASVIYPELLAAKEILHNTRHSWIRQWWEVQGGSLLLLGVKLRASARILGVPLKDLCPAASPYHIVALRRGADTLIPHGLDVLEEGDLAYFMTTPKYVGVIQELAGKEAYPEVRNVVCMGGSETCVHFANLLPPAVKAKIIEKDARRAEVLGELITNPNVMILHGDGRDVSLLEEENIRRAEVFAALTDNSETNILACLTAKRLGVRKTVAMIENTDYIGMAESLDIGSIINKKTFAADHIYRMMLRADVTSVKSLTVAAADVAEFVVSDKAKVTRHPVKDLGLPPTCSLGGLVRDGEAILINGMTQILPGDTVVAFCLENTVKRLERYFK